MHAYIYDEIPGDQRAPHNSGTEVSKEALAALGILYWEIGRGEGWESQVDQIARDRDYKNRDTISVTREGLGALYDEKLKGFFHEHMHEDEEIRYILSGSGYFDIRDDIESAKWIRIAMVAGDLIVLPPGIYHRFTLDEKDSLQAMRLFKDEPKWVPHNRSPITEKNPHREQYLKMVGAV